MSESTNKGSDDLEVHSREKIEIHPENAALDIRCSIKSNDYL